MKTHAQAVIEKMKSQAENRRDARQATAILGGEWVAFGVVDCPVCGGVGALRLCDAVDGAISIWCLNACPPDAVAAGLAELFDRLGLDLLDTPPWRREV